MNSVLSIIICLAMLLSGGSYSETPDAASSRTLTLSGITVTIDGEDYVLEPTASVGVKTENGEVLFDVAVNSGDDVLFPIQAKLSEAGATVLIDEASTAYTFTSELMGMEIPAEEMAFVDAYIRMLADLPHLEDSEEAMAAAMTEAMTKAAADAETTETTYTVDGVEQPAVHALYTIDHDECMAIYDAMIEAYDGEFFDAYFEILNYALSSAMDETGEPMPEIKTISDLFDMIPMTIAIECEQTATEEGIGEADLLMKFEVEESGETFAFEIPMHIDILSAESCVMTMNMVLPEEAGSMSMTAAVDGPSTEMSMSMLINDGTDSGTVEMTMNTLEADDGSIESHLFFEVSVEDVLVGFEMSADTDANGLGSTDVAFGVETADGQYGAAFTATVSDDDIVDRIAGVPNEVLSTEEDVENAAGLMLSFVGLSSDVEKLVAEPSVVALVEAINAMMPAIEDVEIPEAVEDYSDGTDDPSTLSFAIPEFALPEGYVLSEQYIYGEYDCANLCYAYAGEDEGDHPEIYIDLYAGDGGYTDYILNESGELVPSENPVVSVQQQDGCLYATLMLGDVQCIISSYSDAFTMETLAGILSSL